MRLILLFILSTFFGSGVFANEQVLSFWFEDSNGNIDKTLNEVVFEPEEQLIKANQSGVFHLKTSRKQISLRGKDFEARQINLSKGQNLRKFYLLETMAKDLERGFKLPYFAPLARLSDSPNLDSSSIIPNFSPFYSSLAIPKTIKVGRRFASSCSGKPVQKIDEIDFEEYVKGVVNAEIGVFTAVKGAPNKGAESLKTFAIAARTYAFYFVKKYRGKRDFDIDDTACNQRYKEERNIWVDKAVDATKGLILLPKAGGNLGKYEYAASCGHYGTKPAYGKNIIEDKTKSKACVRSWCGHEKCAAHEVNPSVPDKGRCLVRGICQWGSIERAMDGQDYLGILKHYQPNLVLNKNSVEEYLVTGTIKKAGQSEMTEWLMDVELAVFSEAGDKVSETWTNRSGEFSFKVTSSGKYSLSAKKQGYSSLVKEFSILSGQKETKLEFSMEKRSDYSASSLPSPGSKANNGGGSSNNQGSNVSSSGCSLKPEFAFGNINFAIILLLGFFSFFYLKRLGS